MAMPYFEGGLLKTLERDSDGALPAYAWPGGYPIIYTAKTGLTICASCANDPSKTDEDPPLSWEIFYEGPDKTCEDCGAAIESAYGDPNAED